jgi:general secretion pathway protein H
LRLSLEQEGYSMSLGADAGQPQIQMYSSDETSTFSLTFAGKDRVWASLSSDGVGEVMIDD